MHVRQLKRREIFDTTRLLFQSIANASAGIISTGGPLITDAAGLGLGLVSEGVVSFPDPETSWDQFIDHVADALKTVSKVRARLRTRIRVIVRV